MKVRFTRRALGDLAGIDNYIRQDSPTVASEVIARLIERARQLADNPLQGRATDEFPARVIIEPRLRYLIFYTIDGDDIQITHIRHTSRRRPAGWNR